MALSQNHSHPAIAATSRPGQFRGPGIVAAHPGRPVAAVPPTAARAAQQGVGAIPTARRGAAGASGETPRVAPQRRLAEPNVPSQMPPGRHFEGAGPRQAIRPRSAPVRQFATPTTRGPAVGPHTAAAPARHLMMTTHPAVRPQPPHPAAPPHFAAPHFASPRPTAPPHFAAAPASHAAAAAPHFAAPPVGGGRGGPPGKHK
jgi:hypothetical protein